jgi:hypothetical protein
MYYYFRLGCNRSWIAEIDDSDAVDARVLWLNNRPRVIAMKIVCPDSQPVDTVPTSRAYFIYSSPRTPIEHHWCRPSDKYYIIHLACQPQIWSLGSELVVLEFRYPQMDVYITRRNEVRM